MENKLTFRLLKELPRDHKRPSFISVPNQTNPTHIPKTYFLKFHFSSTFPWISAWTCVFRSLSSWLSYHNPVRISSLPIRATYLSHLIHLDLIILIILGEEYVLWSSSLCSFLQPPVMSSLIGPNILLNSLISRSRDSAVGIETGYGLDDQGVGFRVPVGARIFTSPCPPDRL
jgi:hypothetical protein